MVFIQTSCCCVGYASDGGDYMPPPSVSQDQPLPKITVEKPNAVAQAPEKVVSPVVQETPEVKPEKKEGFIPTVLKMFAALGKIVLLILLGFGGVLLYKYLKEQKLFGLPGKQEKTGEPSNVSQAVASYVKHKLKKTT